MYTHVCILYIYIYIMYTCAHIQLSTTIYIYTTIYMVMFQKRCLFGCERSRAAIHDHMLHLYHIYIHILCFFFAILVTSINDDMHCPDSEACQVAGPVPPVHQVPPDPPWAKTVKTASKFQLGNPLRNNVTIGFVKGQFSSFRKLWTLLVVVCQKSQKTDLMAVVFVRTWHRWGSVHVSGMVFCDILIIYPIGSMYGIYANIGGILIVNVTIYSIHGSYGYY